MKAVHAPLVHHLAVVVVLKLMVLGVLWWAFIRPDRVDVGAEQAAAHFSNGDIQGFVITSVVDPGALPDPLAKTVARSADGWWLNYRAQPLLWALPALGLTAALAAAVLVQARHTLSAFVASALAMVGVIGTAGAAMFPS